MSLYNLIQAYNNGSEESMYKSIKIISDFINDKLSDDDKNCLNRCVYGIVSNGHYNKEFAPFYRENTNSHVLMIYYRFPCPKLLSTVLNTTL